MQLGEGGLGTELAGLRERHRHVRAGEVVHEDLLRSVVRQPGPRACLLERAPMLGLTQLSN